MISYSQFSDGGILIPPYMPKLQAPPPKLKDDPKAIKVVLLNLPASATHHDAWLYVKKERTLFYVPFGHHYQLFDALNQMGRQDILHLASSGKTDTKELKFGDVKHGIPRTAKENTITKEPIRSVLVNCFNNARK